MVSLASSCFWRRVGDSNQDKNLCLSHPAVLLLRTQEESTEQKERTSSCGGRWGVTEGRTPDSTGSEWRAQQNSALTRNLQWERRRDRDPQGLGAPSSLANRQAQQRPAWISEICFFYVLLHITLILVIKMISLLPLRLLLPGAVWVQESEICMGVLRKFNMHGQNSHMATVPGHSPLKHWTHHGQCPPSGLPVLLA